MSLKHIKRKYCQKIARKGTFILGMHQTGQ